MYYIYKSFSIAGWIALAVFLIFWAGFACGRRIERRKAAARKGYQVIHSSTEQHEDQP